MSHKAGKKEESRARILASAGRGFRRYGYGGLGVDGIAKEAGVTSGAFYAHFKSKAVAFREAVIAGLQDLRFGVAHLRETRGADWRRGLIDFYLGERLTCDIDQSCALQSLTGEVARADDDVRQAYEAELREVVAVAAAGVEHGSDAKKRLEAIALLALLAGGVSIARAVMDPGLRDEIAAAVRQAAERMSAAPEQEERP